MTFHRHYEPAKDATVVFHTALRKDGDIHHSWSDTLYPKYRDDMRQDMTESGMTIVDVFGDYEKSPFDPLSSPATILIAQKNKK